MATTPTARSRAPLPPCRRSHAIHSLGTGSLDPCLDAVRSLEPAPARVIVVLSGGAELEPRAGIEVTRSARALGFAAATNLGIAHAARDTGRIALLNDDAPRRGVGSRCSARRSTAPPAGRSPRTLTDAPADGSSTPRHRSTAGPAAQVGCGCQYRGDHEPRPALGSGNCCHVAELGLAEASTGRSPHRPAFGSYHEDLDLGLRLCRLGWRSAWVGGVPVRHLGSASGAALHWRHPWWILANRWRALAGNLAAGALLGTLPRLLRGELRALRTLSRSNPRAPAVAAAVRRLAVAGRGGLAARRGRRLAALPEPP
jgi:hypothetical protein